MSESPSITALTEPRPVNVADLEKELSNLWQTSAASEHPVMRACALTLLVYTESEADGREALDLIAKLTMQNPCRAVSIIAQPSASPAGLSAALSAQCHLFAAGEGHVCCEQISLAARGEAVEGLDQVLIPLMVPGLPVYFWWRAGRFAPPSYLNHILRTVDHVLVDSARFPNPEAELLRFREEVRRLSGVQVTDLNWARLTPWREVIAQCFDSAETRPCLDEISEVCIEYEEASPRVLAHRSQSMLLTGWLASSLRWEPVRSTTAPAGNGLSFSFRSGEHTIQVERVPRQFEGGGAGVCLSITLKTAGASPAKFILAREADGKTVRTRHEIAGRPVIERATLLRVSDEVELVNEEIRFAGRDRVYEEALSMAACLLDRRAC